MYGISVVAPRAFLAISRSFSDLESVFLTRRLLQSLNSARSFSANACKVGSL